MSLDLRSRLRQRLERLRGNLEGLRSLVAQAPGLAAPNNPGLAGVAWLLANSYSEFEEVLKGITQEFGESLPDSPTWHQDLLDRVATDTPRRKAVLSQELRLSLDDYLAFRHFSRYSTFAILDWERMRPLVEQLPRVVDCFRGDVERFLTDSGR